MNSCIYIVLFLMVLHLLFSESDPPELLVGAVNGKTTTASSSSSSKATSSSSERLPSYKRPELAGNVVTNNNDPVVKEVHEIDADNQSTDDEYESEQKDGNDDKDKSDEEEEEERSTSQEAENTPETQKSNLEHLDIAANVEALKASVDDVIQRIRDAIEQHMDDAKDELEDEIEKYRNYISELFGEMIMDRFSEDLVDTFEDITLAHMNNKIDKQLQRKFDTMVADASGDIDSLVLRDEDEGADVITMDHHLTEFEKERIAHLETDIEALKNQFIEGMDDMATHSVKIIIQRLMKQLGHPISLRVDGEGELGLLGEGVPQSITFEKTNALAAAEYVRDSIGVVEDDDESEDDEDESEDDEDEGDEDDEEGGNDDDEAAANDDRPPEKDDIESGDDDDRYNEEGNNGTDDEDQDE